MTPQQVKESYRNKHLTVHKYPSTETQFMGFNPTNKVLQNKKMREAISKAINVNYLSSNKTLKGLFQSGVQYVNNANQNDHTYAPAEAQRLIKQLGYTRNGDGYFEKDGKVLSLKLALQTDEFPEWTSILSIIVVIRMG